MLHRHLMISDDGRVAKAILLEQKKYEINDCLMSEMMSDAEELRGRRFITKSTNNYITVHYLQKAETQT